MPTITQRLVKEVMDLPVHARALLAEKLLESLDYDEDFEISEAWGKEIIRRCKLIEQGKAEFIEGEEAFRRLYKAVS